MTPLRHKMIESMRQRGFSVRTQQSYTYAVADLARYHARSPQHLEPADVASYFRHLALERELAPASCRLHLNAIRYFHLKVLERACFDGAVPRCGVHAARAAQWRGVVAPRGIFVVAWLLFRDGVHSPHGKGGGLVRFGFCSQSCSNSALDGLLNTKPGLSCWRRTHSQAATFGH